MIDVIALDGCVLVSGEAYTISAARELADAIHAAAHQAENHQRVSTRTLRDLIASIGDLYA